MVQFTDIITEIRNLQAKDETKRKAADKAASDLKRKVRELTDMCRPHCLAAVKRYNRNASLKIVSESVKLSFNLDQGKLSLHMRLVHLNGVEPDESLESKDEKVMGQKLGRLLNSRLAKAGIPLRLKEVQVPSDYFPK
ncbi:hypothetical protein HYW58_01370 [Candidatus Kaiserbacteria bacterium]|nr:hypothetical protein [Candidatus Kaiserbacteria bacterium]